MKRRTLALLLALPLLAACGGPETLYNSPERENLSDAADSYLSCEWDELQKLDDGESISVTELHERCNFDELNDARQREIANYRSDFSG